MATQKTTVNMSDEMQQNIRIIRDNTGHESATAAIAYALAYYAAVLTKEKSNKSKGRGKR